MGISKNFVVKRGLEVSTDLVLADADSNRVGIATTNPKYPLHVRGGIGATDLIVTGISTFSDLVIDGSISIGGSTGSSGQYLKSIGTGVAWEDLPAGRTSSTFVAASGQSLFEVTYAVGLIDVFVNGIKLSPAEYSAIDGVTVQLVDGCVGGENIEILAYAVQGLGVGVTGITGLTIREEGTTIGNPQGVTSINFVGAAVTASSSGAGVTIAVSGSRWTSAPEGIYKLGNIGIKTTDVSNALSVEGDVNVSGVVTAAVFVGDGSGLINLVGLGSGFGVAVYESNNIVGTATTINFGRNFDVTPISAGFVTVTSINDNPSKWVSTTSGIHTTANVGIGTTNPIFALEVGVVGASGTTLYVNGNARVTGILTVGSSSIILDGSTDTINVGSGITISGSTGSIDAAQLNISGVSTFTDGQIFIGSTSSTGTASQRLQVTGGVYVSGNTGIGTTNPTRSLTVAGSGTSTSQLYVTGVSTLSGQVDFGGGTQIISSGEIKLDNLSRIMLGYSGDTPNGLVIRQNSSSNVSEIVNVGGDDIKIEADSGRSVFIGNDDDNDILTVAGYGVTVTGTTLFAKQLNVSGISTFNNYLKLYDGISFYNDLQDSAGATNNISVVSGVTKRMLFRGNTINKFSFSDYYGGSDHYVFEITKDGDLTASGNLSIAGVSTFAGITTVTGTTLFAKQLNVSGVSTLGIITTTRILVSNTGNNNGSLLITDTGNYSELRFRSSVGNDGALIQGIDQDLYLTANILQLGSIYNYTQSNGDVIFNSSSQGTTEFVNGFSVTGGSVGIGTTNPTSALTVKGNTSLETLNVSGISTLETLNVSGVSTLQTLNVSGISTLETLNVSGISTLGVTTFIGNVSFGTSAYFGNNDKLIFGDSDDLQIFYDGGFSRIWETGANGLEIRTNQFFLSSQDGVENIIRATENSSVELFYDNSKKFETIGAGVTITETAFTNQLSVSGVSTFSGNDIDFTHNGSTRAYWDSSAGALEFKDGDGVVFGTGEDARISWDGTDWVFSKSTSAGSIKFLKSTGSENIAVFTNDGSVELYYDNSKKFETLGAGVTVTGTTFTNQLNVSGVSTFNNNVRVSGIVTANSVLVSNDGGDTGSVLIEDTGAYSQISFRASNGTTQTQIQGVESNLYITPGSSGYIGLSGPTKNIFYETGDVVLNNGLQGTTHAANGLRVTGLTSTTSFNVGTGGTIINATATGLVGIGTTNPTSKLTVRGGDISVGVSTAHGVILTSPNGTQYRLIVSDDGTLSTTAV